MLGEIEREYEWRSEEGEKTEQVSVTRDEWGDEGWCPAHLR